jgi:uncharacterized protein
MEKSISYLSTIDHAKFGDSDSRTITIKVGGSARDVRGADYLFMFGIQNFFVHLTTSYDILRNQGVALGKADFLGKFS